MDDTTETEHAKDNVGAPLDILERRWDEVRECKVEDPVGSRGKTNTLGTVLQRENFGDENPCGGRPCQTVESDKNVTTRNNTGGVAAVHLPLDIEVTSNISDRVTASSHQTSNSEVERSHGDTTVNEQRSAAKFVNEAQGDGCGDEEYYVLNGRRDEVHISSKTGHLEDVDNVVHHDVSAEKLLPDLGGEGGAVFSQGQSHVCDSCAQSNQNVRSPSPHVWPEQTQPGHRFPLSCEQLRFSDFFIFGLHNWVGGIAVPVKEGEDIERLFPAVLGRIPTWRFGEEEQGDN